MQPKIEQYQFGAIIIDGKRYTTDVIIYPQRIDSSWWRKEGHSLHPEDITDIITEQPEVLIVGCGAAGALTVPERTKKYIKAVGIKFFALETDAACHKYNELSSKQKVVAALHLTC